MFKYCKAAASTAQLGCGAWNHGSEFASSQCAFSLLDLREAALEAIWAVASGGWCECAQSNFLEENHVSHRQRRGLCGERQHESRGRRDRRF